MTLVSVNRALLSVYDKTGLVPFAGRLAAAGVAIISSGGTATALEEAGIAVTHVADVTGSPEILGGRVKTLHPRIHGAILARADRQSDLDELSENGIEPIQLVVVNLYPFAETVADESSTESDIIEKIDIGGPSMIRSAAKNHRYVGVVSSADQYEEVAAAIESGGLDDDLRLRLAGEAFFQTAAYDAAIVGWISDNRVLPLRRFADLRYGENPHQEAAVFVEDGAQPWWATSHQHQGKEMSFNNFVDAEAAWALATELGDLSVVVVKHTNPCGAAKGASVFEAFEKAWAGDPLSAFGSVIGINGTLDNSTASAIADRFVEVVIARSVDVDALEILSAKKNLRVLSARPPHGKDEDYRRVEEGFLSQGRDSVVGEMWKVVSERSPTAEEDTALKFSWIVAAATKSNAIVLAADGQALGVGAGDQSRVGAAERAVAKAGARAKGAVAASDAFFPFRDGLDTLVKAGVTAVVEPGGSRNDQEIVDAANEHGVALVFAGDRHFRH
jgi:phosphoribosylaminoimidazolecarboxamide formyltransferase/IMP cyclohydrolase